MSEYKQQVQRFRDYLTQQLEEPNAEEYSLEVLLELWRHENPSPSLFQENVRAIQQAIDELTTDPGITIAEHDGAIREKYPFLRKV